MFVKNSHVGQLLGGKAAGITSMLTQYGSLFDELADNGFADTVESLLGGKDSTAVARLLTLGEYNPDEYMNGARDSSGSGKTYYRQSWTIRREGWAYAKEILEEQTLSHPYYIDKQSSSCRYYTFLPEYQCFADITDLEWNMLYYVQRNSSMKWTKAKVDAENRNQSEWVYHWDYTVTYTFNRTEWVSGREYEAWKATFAIVVWRERQARPGGDVYEEMYDSKTMDLDEFRQLMNEKLAEYLATDDGYELVEGEKIPYTEVTLSEVRSASSCSFNMKCDETTDLGSGHILKKFIGVQVEFVAARGHRQIRASVPPRDRDVDALALRRCLIQLDQCFLGGEQRPVFLTFIELLSVDDLVDEVETFADVTFLCCECFFHGMIPS
jgi:hypothetical protein